MIAPTQTTLASAFTRNQKFMIALLSFLQFTIILDFMILAPLGAVLMPSMKITPSQFGGVVSIYAFSAGISGLLAAGFADRFDRKKLLLFFYVGFILGTLFCALSPSYHFLLAARMITGLFGGVIGSVVFAIITDMFPFEMRGRVMGFVQTGFAASQVLGIPIGLFFSNLWGWHAPFLMIVLVGSIVGIFIWRNLRPIDGHLHKEVEESAFRHLWSIVSRGRYLLACSATALMTLGGYMIMPFSSAFIVHNVGIDLNRLPMIYFFTGMSTIFVGPQIGKLADRFGKFNLFALGTLISIVMVVIFTNLTKAPFWMVVLINVVMFIGIFSRIVPSQALMSAIPKPSDRGAFNAISSSIQQMSGGVASIVAGWIVVESSAGKLLHFNVLGYVMVALMLMAFELMRRVHRLVPENHDPV